MTSPPDLAEIYATHRPGLVRLAVLLVDDQASAEDVVQDAFAGLVKRRARRGDPEAILGYLRTSVVNGARSTLRRRRTARGYTPPVSVEPPNPEEVALMAEEHREVWRALGALTERQREVLVLRYWADLSEAQIAEATGLARGTIKSTASRALVALENEMARKGATR